MLHGSPVHFHVTMALQLQIMTKAATSIFIIINHDSEQNKFIFMNMMYIFDHTKNVVALYTISTYLHS